jgi:hypothetical protein
VSVAVGPVVQSFLHPLDEQEEEELAEVKREIPVLGMSILDPTTDCGC